MKLRLPAVFNKFLQPLQVSGEEFFMQWRSLSGPPLKLQEVVCLYCPLYSDAWNIYYYLQIFTMFSYLIR